MFFKESRGTIEVSEFPSKVNKVALFYVVKLEQESLSDQYIGKQIILGDLSSDPMENIAMMTEMVCHPIVESKGAAQIWSETITKEIRENIDFFLANIQITQGHMHGVTCLPLPISNDDSNIGSVDFENDENSSHLVHSLESAIINWTRQIKNVLKLDPQNILISGNNPGPLAEIEFWKSKAINLNGIFSQLQSVRVRRILKILDKSKSTYNAPFAKLCKEVFHARAEANNIIKYLQPLVAWFEALENENDFDSITNLFHPILHTLLLVWKSSAYYNTPSRLVVIMREISNTIIRQATSYLEGDALFDLIDAGDTSIVVKKLEATLRVMGIFKSVYFEYKSRTSLECPENAWKIQNNAIFVRLDGFLERCHDFLDLTQTIVMFSKLQKIEIGGTKGKILTTSVTQIFVDFSQSVENVKSVGEGILDLENKEFENAFYEFRTRMKELDRRVGSVITQGFDDAYTVHGRFRLLDSFENIISRSIVADALEKRHAALITGIAEEISDIQTKYVEENDSPPISNNLPPIAGALTWSRGLLQRAQIPMEKLKTLDKKVLDRDDTRDVIKVYTALISYLADYENGKIKEWGISIEESSQAKLRNPLLVREIESFYLKVNFDPLLVRLLREVKYFLLLGLDIPSSAMDVFKMSETFRRHTGNLDLIVNMYNSIHQLLLPVEKPLVRNQLDRIDKILSKGIGDVMEQTKSLNWKSSGIEVFIGEGMAETKEVTEILKLLKENLKSTETIVDKWKTTPIFERNAKTSTVEDFTQLQKKIRQTRLALIKESGNEVHKLLKDTNRRLKVSQGSPDWKAYVDFINDIVVSGLVYSIFVSLKALSCQLDAKYLEINNLSPLIEIQCDLLDCEVSFVPEIGSLDSNEKKVVGVKYLVFSWINGMLGASAAFKRVDIGEGTYLREFSDHPMIQIQRQHISRLLSTLETNANGLRKQFKKYEYLWHSDMNQAFSKFLMDAVVVEYIPFADIDEEQSNTNNGSNNDMKLCEEHKGSGSRGYWKHSRYDLEKFNEKIRFYLAIQSEVSDLKATYDVDFLKVNAQPIKQAISMWATKWLFMFSQFLQGEVGTKLKDLAEFIKSVSIGLDVDPRDGESVMSVMAHIRDVRKRTPEIASMFEPQRDIIMLLKRHSITIDLEPVDGQPALEFLENSKMFWEGIVNKTYRVKEVIQPTQNKMLEKIRKQVQDFEASVSKFSKEFKSTLTKSGPFAWQDLSRQEIRRKRSIYNAIDGYYAKIGSFKKEGKALNELEDLFELPMSRLSELNEMEHELCLVKGTWDIVLLVDSLFISWRNTLWADIKTDDLLDEVRSLQVQMKKQSKSCKGWDVTTKLDLHVKNMATILPLIHELHSPCMRDRHWKNLMTTTSTSFERGPSFSLNDLINLHLHKFVEPVMDIVEMANKELKIEMKLNAIDESWNTLRLQFDRHRDTEVFIVMPPDDVLELLEEHSLQLQGMAGMGKFVDFFRDQVTKWLSTLGEVDTNLKLLLTVERLWGSLESIFLGSADIRAQLPDDTKRFESVDSDFKETMAEVQMNPGVITCCSAEGREQMLCNMLKELEKCEKALNEYLEIKKSVFPRFYFVSNAALLDILSNGNNPPKILPHIGSVFDGIGDLGLCYSEGQEIMMAEANNNGETVNPGPFEAAKSMISKDKEVVSFHIKFEMKGAVELWLNELVGFMRFTLKNVLSDSISDASGWDVEHPREEWVFKFPAQIALVTSQIGWTEEVERALEEFESGQEDSVKKYCELCTSRIEGLIRLVQGELTTEDRIKIITVITIDVHNRDVVQTLVDKRVESNIDFKWQSQLKFYWDPDERNVTIRICDFSSIYSFEYVGNCGRLVITPLTDRCYVTLTVALLLMLGGAPAGPAGTGKTETTKDLARGMGLPCYVFNCSDQMNYQTMADIFKGLTQVGSWGCFDEFNRIDIEVLSVVASQVKCILDAIAFLSEPANREKEFQTLPKGNVTVKVGSFDFFGSIISLIPTVGLFITMNPGYAGRTELPENLKALFRSCAMIQPDFLPISENMLMSEGFVNARPLSVKFVTLYRLCSELLSKQHHYDWGLRAIKSVLRVAGMLKRADPDLKEEAVLMRALRDFNTPKIPSSDIPVFLRLITDLFPSLDLSPKLNKALDIICRKVCKIKALQPEDIFVNKVLQFKELLDVRHSVMLLGPAGCGKTSVWKTLVACHNYEKPKPISVYDVVNPKAVSTDELYGYMTLTKDWRDGVLSIMMRNMSKNVSPYSQIQTCKWVVLDGDIDAIWIESMNTVMDDNKVLTLVSNERIPLSDAMRMVFEIHTLRNATPATVSRAGILYINDTDIGYLPYVESWINGRTSETEKSYLPDLFDRYLNKVIEFFSTTKMEHIIPISILNVVQSLCLILDGLLKSSNCADQPSAIERMFVYSTVWAFGGALTSDKQQDNRKNFSTFLKSLFTKGFKFPDAGLVFDYFIDFSSGEVMLWSDKLYSYAAASGDGFQSSIFVPTTNTIRLRHLLDILVNNDHPVMFVGSAGTGKTVIVNDYLFDISSDDGFNFASINMNYYTDSYSLQKQLEQSIDKRSGKSFGPPSGKLVYFIDDLNLPAVEKYGTQTPIELIRQHIDSGSWFDRNDMGLKKQIMDCQYVVCMNHKSGSFVVSSRLQRHFTTFSCEMPEEADLFTIYTTLLTGHFFSFERKIQNITRNLAEASMVLLKEMVSKFLPSATKFHYNFTVRDLTSIVKGLMSSKANKYTEPADIVRLWYHEAMRVFSDRLISEVEISRCRENIINIGKRFMDENPDVVFTEPCSFTYFVDDPEELSFYTVCENQSKLRDILENKLVEYNENNTIMNLVLFEEAIRHIVRVSRILMMPGGNALLVGVGGSGKQSLSKLAAFICHLSVHQIAVTSDYNVNDLKENLRDMYRRAGVKPGLPMTFLLADSQIVDEHFLVYINDLLSSGYIPDLFTKEEYDGIFASLRNIAKADGVPDNRSSMLDYFISKVRSNLHVVLCFSPVGDTFRQRARKFPGIVNCTSIDWFLEWPKDALVSVALRFLENVDIKPEIRENIAYHMAEVHLSVGTASVEYYRREKRFNYTTPKSFLELIDFYKNLLRNRKMEMLASIKRLETGLDTLMRTNKDVKSLQEFLEVKRVEVEAKKAATDDLLEAMVEQRNEAMEQENVADNEKRKADDAAMKARELEEQAAGDLAVAKPALDAAIEAVKCLDKSSLTELKTFPKCPPGVDKVTTAVLIMIKLEKKDFSWDNAKKMMAKVDAFKEKLESYKGEEIPEDVVERVSKIIDDPDFTFERMKTKSNAAANLCNWVINIVKFNGIYKRCKPLMDSLNEATKSKAKAEEDLGAVTAILDVIQGKLDQLKRAFELATDEKARVEAEAKDCMDRLNLAERLTNGLSSEKERWGLAVEELIASEVTMAGDVMVAASFSSYVGPFSASFRSTLWGEKWVNDLRSREVQLTQNVDPLWVLTSESHTAVWQNQGLPADRISIENGAILTNCSRWPLLIDPQLQGIRWLKSFAEDRAAAASRSLCILRPNEKRWTTKLVDAIQSGDTVILEGVGEELEASLEPILMKSVYRKGKNLYIRIGEDDIEYDEEFRLYLQTKWSNPHYKPEIAAQCTIINFIVTQKGLEDQLLANIVSEEEPELEKTKNELVQAFNEYKIQLKSLEDQLLERLANAPEDILSDIPLIEGLEATKETANGINEAVQRGKQTEVGINKAREGYRVVATEASLLYFVMLQLSSVNHMYQYSLDSFTYFFLKALKNAPEGTDVTDRVDMLQSTLRWTVFKWVVRGLFDEHRLIFLTQYTLSLLQQGILRDDSGYSNEALRFILLGYSRSTGEITNSPISWLDNFSWNGIKNLSTLEGFEKISSDIEENGPRFLEWFQSFMPEEEKLPMDWRELDKAPFKKLMVIRVLRPDRMTAAITNFIRDVLPKGKDFIECDNDLSGFQIFEQSFEDSSPLIPIYFVVSLGSNIVNDVDKLAARVGKTKGIDYHNISLGQGQDVVAAEKLEVGSRQGHWVFLNNVHLMPRWLLVLEKKLDEYAKIGTHEDFRIILSSDPSGSIPVSILERSIKITSDPPSGLKANLKQAIASFTKDFYEDLEPRIRGILFGLCQFHAVVVERKKFGTKGYNMSYPFSVGDLVNSATVLRNYMETAPAKVPWVDLRYLFGEIMYGGHIVNAFDRILANTYLDYFMKEDILDEMVLYPYLDKDFGNADVFKAPSPTFNYDKLVEHVEECLTSETPVAFGLHPNAEIGMRTRKSDDLLKMVLELSTGNDNSSEEGKNGQQVTETIVQEILDALRDCKFEIDTIVMNLDDLGPFQNVVIQECERMNALTSDIVLSLIELDLGFRGMLTMSERMEDLASSLYLDRVPKRWETLAYPSLRTLGTWFIDLQSRMTQLSEWSGNPGESPLVAWISGLFNPQSFVTAVMQKTAQEKNLELDKLNLLVDITKKMQADEITQHPKDGSYIAGLYLEGGSWNVANSLLEPSKPREMYCPLPVINIKPSISEKVDNSVFMCPVYKTQQRGPTYVFSIQLRTKHDQGKWILAGVVSVLDKVS